MRLTLRMDVDNDCFVGANPIFTPWNRGEEIGYILAKLSERMDVEGVVHGSLGNLMDTDGNKVGEWEVLNT